MVVFHRMCRCYSHDPTSALYACTYVHPRYAASTVGELTNTRFRLTSDFFSDGENQKKKIRGNDNVLNGPK